MPTLTIRVTERLKTRIAAAAKRAGATAQRFILDAVAAKLDDERRSRVHRAAEQQGAGIVSTGESMPWSAVRAKLVRRAASKKQRVLRNAVLRAAKALGIGPSPLARSLEIGQEWTSRLTQGDYFPREGSSAWKRATQLIRLHRGLHTILAGDEHAMDAWMRSPNTDLGAKPIECIVTARGLRKVTEYVESSQARV